VIKQIPAVQTLGTSLIIDLSKATCTVAGTQCTVFLTARSQCCWVGATVWGGRHMSVWME